MKRLHAPEVLELTRRLAEAEETLSAITRGAVDALLVTVPQGPQVFTLSGAEEPYRLLVERMNDGALTISDDGTVLYSNRRFAELTGVALQQIVGRHVESYVPHGHSGAMHELLAQASQRPLCREISFKSAGGGTIPAMVWAGPVVIDEQPMLLMTVADLSAQKHADKIAADERFARSLLEQAAEALVVCDTSGRVTHVSRAAEQLFHLPPVGRWFDEVFPLVLAEPHRRTLAALTSGSGGKGTQSLRGVEATIAGQEFAARHFLVSAGSLEDVDGSTMGCTVALVEITERKRAEERQVTLIAELNHRVKNILAIVGSVAKQTAANASSVAAFAAAFDGRLMGLALAHDVLTRVFWGSAEFGRLLAESLAPYSDLSAHRVSVVGPEVLLPSHAVVPLAMVLHELTTNAVKYGALSTTAGILDISSTITDQDGAALVRVVWAERGTLTLAPPGPAGFGTRLIDRIVAYDLDGTAELDFRADGLQCVLSFPLQAERSEALTFANVP